MSRQSPIVVRAGIRFDWDSRRGTVVQANGIAIALKFDDQNCHESPDLFKPHHIYDAYYNERFQLVSEDKSAVVFEPVKTANDAEIYRQMEAHLNLLDESRHPRSLQSAERVIAELKELYGENSKLSLSPITLYRKYCRWIDLHRDTAKLLKWRSGKRTPKTSQDVEDLVHEIIDTVFLTRENYSILHAFCVFRKAHKERGLESSCLGKSAFYERVHSLDPYLVALHRKGRDAAKKIATVNRGMIHADFPLQYVEVDAVHLNVGIIDIETGEYRGTLIVYIAIDRRTRYVLGYSTSIKASGKGETAEGFIDCLSHAMLPKPHTSNTVNPWVGHGQIRYVVMDPSAAGTSVSLTCFLAQMRIKRAVTEASTPQKKPFIERFNRTLREQFAKFLPGYQLNRHHGVEYERSIKEMACMSQNEAEKVLEQYFVDVYNQNPHKGLDGDTPYRTFIEETEVGPPISLIDKEALHMFRGYEVKRTIQYGYRIQNENILYSSEELKNIKTRMDMSKNVTDNKVLIRFNESDVSRIVVINPHTLEAFWANAVNDRIAPGTSLKDYKSDKKKIDSGITRKSIESNNDLKNIRARLAAIHRERLKLTRKRKSEPVHVAENLSNESLDDMLNEGRSRFATFAHEPTSSVALDEMSDDVDLSSIDRFEGQ